MSTMDSEKFKRICDDVWRDRAAILLTSSALSGEAVLIRAVYWRFRKAGGGEEGQNIGEYAPLLNELVRQYRDEAGQSC